MTTERKQDDMYINSGYLFNSRIPFKEPISYSPDPVFRHGVRRAVLTGSSFISLPVKGILFWMGMR